MKKLLVITFVFLTLFIACCDRQSIDNKESKINIDIETKNGITCQRFETSNNCPFIIYIIEIKNHEYISTGEGVFTHSESCQCKKDTIQFNNNY